MSSTFVPLALFFKPLVSEPVHESEASIASAPSIVATPGEHQEAIRAARLFCAGLRDALDATLPQLLGEIAREVLARELRLGDAEIAALVTATLARFANERVLCIRAHPTDAAVLAGMEPETIPDDTVRRGDVRIELRSGTIDLTLEARLESVLAAWDA